MRWTAWAIAAGAATTLLFACVGTSPTLPTSQCDGTDTFCNGACTNTQGDVRNCGACGKTCPMGEVCQKGACGPSCSGGTARCGMGCIDVQNDPANCGDCNKKCASAESCVMGKCTLLCQMGLSACPSAPAPPADGGTADSGATDGGGPASANACVDLQTDPRNCGKCGNVCPPDKNGCDKGVCKIYKFSGIVQNLNQDDLVSSWSECFAETYATSGTALATVLTTKCTGANLMLGCRTTATKTLILAAQAPRADVTFDVGNGSAASRVANGVAWYYSTSASWGFFAPLDIVARTSCDTTTGAFPDRRLCWHTSSSQLQGGYRCGTQTGLNNSAAYERVILQAP